MPALEGNEYVKVFRYQNPNVSVNRKTLTITETHNSAMKVYKGNDSRVVFSGVGTARFPVAFVGTWFEINYFLVTNVYVIILYSENQKLDFLSNRRLAWNSLFMLEGSMSLDYVYLPLQLSK